MMIGSTLDIASIKEASRHNWRRIFAKLGIDVPDNPKKHGPCPTCGGKDRFRFDDEDGRGTWFCNQCDPRAGDGFDLLQNVACCDFKAAADLVQDALGEAPLAPHRPQPNGHKTMNGIPLVERRVTAQTLPPNGEIGKTLFCYEAADGVPAFYVQRIEKLDGKKVFPQWGPTEDGHGWQANMDHAPKLRPLYRLPHILTDPDGVVFIHEGEKAVHAHLAASLPGIPTTSSQGAEKAKFTDFSPLAGRTVVICPDNDPPGEQHANDVAARAHSAGARSVRILRLPDLPPKGDVVEWLEAGGTAETFTALIEMGEEVQAVDVEPAEERKSLAAALVSYRDLMAMAIPERARHLAWLAEGGNVMVFGPRGVGKTMLQLALAVSLTTGEQLLRWPITTPVGVLYIDGEMQLDELRNRATALMKRPPVAPLEFLTSEVVYTRLQRDLVLTSDEVRQEVVSILDGRPDIRVIILDNISCLFSGINEDSKQDWEPINAWLIRLRHRGLTTVLVHHAGKQGQQRGTSGREDSLDTVIQLNKPANHDAREGCHFELNFTKCRSVKGEDVAPIDVRLEERGGQLEWTWSSMEASKIAQAKLLFADGVTSPSDLAEELGVSRGYASKLLKKLNAGMER